MFLHLGQETVVSGKEIIGLFDIDKTTVSKTTRNFLKKAQKNGKIKEVSFEIPKTFIITGDRDKNTVYLSQISASTLCKRAANSTFVE